MITWTDIIGTGTITGILVMSSPMPIDANH